MKSKIICLIFVLFTVISNSFSQSEDFKRLDPHTVKSDIQADSIVLIDVRTPEEFESGHIGNARNWDFYEDDFYDHFKEFEKDKAIYLYCGSGMRSGKAAQKLTEKGFTNIHDLKEGIEAWETHE